MFGILFRLLWRLVVFALLTAAIYAVLFELFPWLDKYIPLVVVVLVVYGLIAYGVFPLAVRLWRVVLKPNHLPLYVTTADGWPSDPVNIAIVAKSRRDFIKIMKKAGWTVADKVTPATMWRMAVATVLGRQYPTAPFSSLYLFGRKQDIGFQIQTGNPPSPRHRHHVRFWQLKKPVHEHETFWQALLNRFVRPKHQIWIGAATHDIAPFAFRWRNLQLTHQIDANTNTEREFVISTLKKSRQLGPVATITSGEQLTFRGQTFGVNIVVDGEIKVIALKRPIIARRTKTPDDI
jgi:hypothetical protein